MITVSVDDTDLAAGAIWFLISDDILLHHRGGGEEGGRGGTLP